MSPASKTPKRPSEGTVAEEAEVLELFTAGELEAFEARADYWMKGNLGDFEAYTEKQSLIVYQILADMATGRKRIPGRTGANIQARAMRDFVSQAEKVLDILGGEKEKPKK